MQQMSLRSGYPRCVYPGFACKLLFDRAGFAGADGPEHITELMT